MDTHTQDTHTHIDTYMHTPNTHKHTCKHMQCFADHMRQLVRRLRPAVLAISYIRTCTSHMWGCAFLNACACILICTCT